MLKQPFPILGEHIVLELDGDYFRTNYCCLTTSTPGLVSYTALEETGLDTLRDRWTQLSLSFAKKCLKSDRMADLFPLKINTVNSRPHEKYFVTPAHDARLAKSSVPYLQRLLNNQ